jgi:osmotically-inducible protein OsmY
MMSQDNQLQQDVLAELKWEPSVTAAHIGVAAKDGVVTLSGQVENFMNKFAAERAARRVQGVKAVAEEIEVRLPTDKRRTDEQIAAAIVERLAWNVSVPQGAIQVKVEKGLVTLSGQVEWHFQKEAAEMDVQRLHGVMGLINMITMKPQVDVKSIGDDIKTALKRSRYSPLASRALRRGSHRVECAGNDLGRERPHDQLGREPSRRPDNQVRRGWGRPDHQRGSFRDRPGGA